YHKNRKNTGVTAILSEEIAQRLWSVCFSSQALPRRKPRKAGAPWQGTLEREIQQAWDQNQSAVTIALSSMSLEHPYHGRNLSPRLPLGLDPFPRMQTEDVMTHIPAMGTT